MNAIERGAPAGDYDPFDLNAPHAHWQFFRENAPVFYHAETNYWIVTRYDDIKAIFDDWQTFSSENAQAPMRPMCEAGRQVMKDGGFTAYSGLTARVPPDHTRIRKIAQSCFGPRRFKSIEPKIEIIGQTIHARGFLERGGVPGSGPCVVHAGWRAGCRRADDQEFW